VIVPGSGQLDPIPPNDPTPPAQLVEDTLPGIKVINPARTISEGGEEATLRVGQFDTGHDLEAIAEA